MPVTGFGAWYSLSILNAPRFYLPLATNQANEKAASISGSLPKPRLASTII